MRTAPWTHLQERIGSRLIRIMSATNVWVYRLTGGRLGGRLPGGVPVLLLTTIGRRSGQRRTSPLLVPKGRRGPGSSGLKGGNAQAPSVVPQSGDEFSGRGPDRPTSAEDGGPVRHERGEVNPLAGTCLHVRGLRGLPGQNSPGDPGDHPLCRATLLPRPRAFPALTDILGAEGTETSQGVMSRILTALLLWLALTTQTLAVQNLLVVYPDIEHGSSTLIVSSTGNAVLVDNSLGDRVFRPRWPWGGCLVLCRKGEPWSTSDPLTTTASAYIRSLDGDATILPRTTPFDKDRRNKCAL